MKDEATEGSYYTNKDMLRMFHPDKKALPHIYDSLEYTHCEESFEEDVEDTKHAEFRHRLHSKLRKRLAKHYNAKVKDGYTDEEAAKLNKYYEAMFDQKSLGNYGKRPIYKGES